MEHLIVDGAVLEYEVQGSEEPVLLIHLSLVPDGLARPLLTQPVLASRYRLIHYYRRGYGGSTLGTEPLTIPRLASDAAALLKHLQVKSAHIAGHSMGGLVALQLAVDAPSLVHSLALLEPPLRMVPGGQESLQSTILPMLNAYRSGDKQKALGIFCDAVFGSNWRDILERAIPGSTAQAVQGMDLFIQEQSAIQQWQFGPTEAAMIKQPVLSVVGIHSTALVKEGRKLIHAWLPQTEDFDAQSTHLLQLQDPQGVARALAEFFARHPMM